MAKLSYNEQLQRLIVAKKKVDKEEKKTDEARNELALKIGRYILTLNEDIRTLTQFKTLWKKLNE